MSDSVLQRASLSMMDSDITLTRFESHGMEDVWHRNTDTSPDITTSSSVEALLPLQSDKALAPML